MPSRETRHRILLLEDELSLRRGIRFNLEQEGFEVVDFETAEQALDGYRKNPLFSLCILDIMTPGKLDGLALCKEIRKHNTALPILFLTAKNRLDDKLAGFDAGADDYLTKPFDLEELLARVRARLRHSGSSSVYTIGSFRFDAQSGTIHAPNDAEVIRLNDREKGILVLLLQNRGKPVSRDLILDTVWGTAEFPTNRTIDNFIVKFRKIFEADPRNPRYFITRHGTGYELADE